MTTSPRTLSKHLGTIADIFYLPTEKYGVDNNDKRVFSTSSAKATTIAF